MRKWRATLLAGFVSLTAASAAPAQDIRPPMPSPEEMQRIRQLEAAARVAPDTPGSGPWPAMKEEVPSLPSHVVYRPRALSSFKGKLPVVAWGNGGCGPDGAAQRLHLAELASHGYLVIANGQVLSGPGMEPPAPPLPPAARIPGAPFTPPPPQTSAAQMTQAIDWALAQNAEPDSALHGKIDTQAIAVSGWSCGGLQALSVASSDPRVRTTVIHNSGIFPEGAPRMPGMDVGKDALGKLRAPVIYILGGPTDIACANGVDDFRRISKVPAFLASTDVGHTGTFFQPDGGSAAKVALAWLDWRLKGDRSAARWFTGADCRLCGDPQWKVESKGF